MKTTKAVFFMLATLVASVSADVVWQKVRGDLDDSEQLATSEDEQEARPFDAIHAIIPGEIAELKLSKSSKSSKSTSSTSSRSKSSKSNNKKRCVDKKKPSVNRSGTRYRFELERSDARCVDGKNRYYEYGEIRKVKSFSKCADACVKDVRSSILSSFRGYDYDCKKDRCRCLYDRGTLNSRNSNTFSRTYRKEDGKGRVRSTKKSSDMHCAKLTSAKFVGANDELDEEEEIDSDARRALRGGI